MFKIKRPAIIGLLLGLLVFTGYLNYELTQEALKKTSNRYKEHELSEKTDYEDNDKQKKDFEIVDSEKPENKEEVTETSASDLEDIEEVVNTNNKEIDKKISKEASSQNRNYYIEYKLSRDKLRASLVDRLDDIVSNDKTDSKTRGKAQREIMTIGHISEKELQIEGLIKAKGFDDSLVVLTEEDVKVIISTSELSEQDMIKILDIVKEETKFDINNIKIIEKQ